MAAFQVAPWVEQGPALGDWPPDPPHEQEKRHKHALGAVQERRREYNMWLGLQLAAVEGPRVCTDVFCCALLAALVFAVLVATTLALVRGDPRWLEREVDYHARLCSWQRGKPYVYWPRPPELEWRVCVDKCPDSIDVVNSEHANLPAFSPLTILRSGRSLELSQWLWSAQVPVYPTELVFGRFCLATPNTTLLAANSTRDDGKDGHLPATSTAAHALLGPLRRGPGSPSQQLRRFLGDLGGRDVLNPAATLVGLVFVAGGIPPLLIRYVPRLGTSVAVLGGIAVTLVVGLALLAEAKKANDDFRFLAVADLQPKLSAATGWVLLAACGIMAIVPLFFRHTLSQAASVSSLVFSLVGADAQLRSLWLLPFLVALVQLSGLLALVLVMPWVLSIADVAWPRFEVDKVRTNATSPLPPASELFQGLGTDDWGPVVFGFLRTLEFADGLSLIVVLVLLLALRTWLALIEAIACITTTCTVSSWYFIPPGKGGSRDVPGCLLFRSLCVSLRYHFGTAAARGVLMAVLPLPFRFVRALAVCAASWQEPWDEEPLAPDTSDEDASPRVSLCGAGGGFRGLAYLLGPLAVADSAVRGAAAGAAAAHAAELMGAALPAVQFLVGTPVLISVMTVLPISLVVWPAGLTLVNVETARVGVALVLTVAAYLAVSAWATVYEAVVDAFLFCLALDDAGHRSFGFGADDPFPDIRLRAFPPITADNSFALWSSVFTPPRLRGFIFDMSLAMRDEYEPVAGDADAQSMLGDVGSGSERNDGEESY